MSAYARQLQAAQRQYESQAECDQHGRRPTGPDDGDLYADGWTVGATARRFNGFAVPAQSKSLAELEAESLAYWGIHA